VSSVACTGAQSRDQVQCCVLHVLVLKVETRCSVVCSRYWHTTWPAAVCPWHVSTVTDSMLLQRKINCKVDLERWAQQSQRFAKAKHREVTGKGQRIRASSSHHHKPMCHLLL